MISTPTSEQVVTEVLPLVMSRATSKVLCKFRSSLYEGMTIEITAARELEHTGLANAARSFSCVMRLLVFVHLLVRRLWGEGTKDNKKKKL